MSASPSPPPSPALPKDEETAVETAQEPPSQIPDDVDAEPKASGSNPEISSQNSTSPPPATTPDAWQAIWSAQHNAYYFFNSATQETTWINPLQPPNAEGETSAEASSSASPQPESSTSTSASHYTALQANAIAQGIDPSLAYLDPSLASTSGVPSNTTYAAKFNARTGAFAKPDSRDPTHLSEYERAKRMSEFYFDVGAWEKDVEERKRAEEEGEGKKRKRPTKKDLVRSFTLWWSTLYFLTSYHYRNALRSRRNRKR
ncbi:hypothetical protein BJ138DRAFT_70743 [Hygrophoropsis aurantiaca]|uniref:Uncharacterized protein n=1 Tax=Hygrophoropsis aurantiaca TaxID=72124 RepID=A0ACB8AC90_9AGAM|nr:hypothetical protein BJ138DRAFT_70743 [Hygrophoropsis aurantiaca]